MRATILPYSGPECGSQSPWLNRFQKPGSERDRSQLGYQVGALGFIWGHPGQPGPPLFLLHSNEHRHLRSSYQIQAHSFT